MEAALKTSAAPNFFANTEAPRNWKKAAAVLLCLLLGVGSFLYVASPHPAEPYGLILTPSTVEAMDEAFSAGEGWKLLLPYAYYKADYERYAWPPSVLFPTYFLEKHLPPKAVYLTLALLMVGVVFMCAYSASGSFTFAGMFSILLSCSTHLHYNFTMGNTNLFYIVYCYAALHIHAMLPWLSGKKTGTKEWIFLLLSLMLLFLASDHWLAYACGVIGAMLLLAALCLKNNDKKNLQRIRIPLAGILCFLTVYTVVRSLYAGEHVAPGTEEELIFTYRKAALILDDFINNFLTFLYMVLSNFLPPIPYVDGSQSAIFLDKAAVLAGQNGYHPTHTELVWYNHVFMWRYAAGALITLFFIYAWQALRKTWTTLSADGAVKLFLCTAVCSSFSFYLLIKMRPYNSMPALGYKVSFGVFFFSLLLCYAITRLRERMKARNFALLYGGCIALTLFTFLTKPFMLTKWLQVDGLVGMWQSPLTNFLGKLFQ